jgi:hypothetical protein
VADTKKPRVSASLTRSPRPASLRNLSGAGTAKGHGPFAPFVAPCGPPVTPSITRHSKVQDVHGLGVSLPDASAPRRHGLREEPTTRVPGEHTVGGYLLLAELPLRAGQALEDLGRTQSILTRCWSTIRPRCSGVGC